MSNQVYSNSQSKYWPLPGINNYVCSASPEQTIAAGNATDVFIDDESLIQGSDLILQSSGGLSTVISPGIYSFTYNIAFTSAQNTAPCVVAKMILGSTANPAANETVLAQVGARYAAWNFAALPTNVISLSYTGYFAYLDVVRCQVTNDANSTTITIKDAHTNLVICKLA